MTDARLPQERLSELEERVVSIERELGMEPSEFDAEIYRARAADLEDAVARIQDELDQRAAAQNQTLDAVMTE